MVAGGIAKLAIIAASYIPLMVKRKKSLELLKLDKPLGCLANKLMHKVKLQRFS